MVQRGKIKQKMGEKQKKIGSQIHFNSLTSGVENACREKKRLSSEAQLSLRSTSSVEWPRYTERDAGFGAGLEGSFFWVGFPFCIRPHMWKMNGGKGCRVSLWGDDSRSYNAPGFIPTFLRYTGKYTYSLLMGRSSGTWLQEYSIGNSTNVEFSES